MASARVARADELPWRGVIPLSAAKRDLVEFLPALVHAKNADVSVVMVSIGIYATINIKYARGRDGRVFPTNVAG